NFVRRGVQLTAQAAERHAIGLAIGEIKQSIDRWVFACPMPVELARERAFHWIFFLEERLKTFQRHFFEIHIRRPFVLWPENPPFQVQRTFDIRLHRSKPRMTLRDRKFRRGIGQIRFDRIESQTVVCDSLSASMTCERWRAECARKLSVPPRATAQHGFASVSIRPANCANKV